MRYRNYFLMLLLLAAGMSSAASKMQTFVGEVSDAMCGAKHMMADKAECTRACVVKGSKYALVTSDKVLLLETSNKTALDELNSVAGAQAKIIGTVDGDTIKVSKVEPEK